MKRFILAIMVLIMVITAVAVPQAVYGDDNEDLSLLTPSEQDFKSEFDWQYEQFGKYLPILMYYTRQQFNDADDIAYHLTNISNQEPVCIIQSAPGVMENIRKRWNNEICAGMEKLKKKVTSHMEELMENWDSPDTREVLQKQLNDYAKEFARDCQHLLDLASGYNDSLKQITDELISNRKAWREEAKPLIEEAKDVIKKDAEQKQKDDKNSGSDQGGDLDDLFDSDCFIATAAYGSSTTVEIDILRRFRDEFLLHNYPGRAFVAVYYATSPPVAWFISEHELLRSAVREGFVNPIVVVTELTENWWAK